MNKLKNSFVLLFSVSLIFGTAGGAKALLFTGTPSPTLSPIFGILINFDDLKINSWLEPNAYESLGVSLVGTEPGGQDYKLWVETGPQSKPNYLNTGPFRNYNGTILVEFLELTSKVAIGVANSRQGPETITAYDRNWKILESYQVPSGRNVYVGIDRGGIPEIKFFEIKGEYFAIDDLQFNSRPVPEPATILLLGLGVASFLGLRGKARV
jgi:hypothetical protein